MKPIVIVGGGIAGFAAAAAFHRARLPVVVLDKDRAPGGRMTSLEGEDWLVDVGCPFVQSGDHVLLDLIRGVGLGSEALALQGAVRVLSAEGSVKPSPEGPPVHRRALRDGMISLFRRWQREVPFVAGVEVGAIRWSESEKTFLFRDVLTGRVVRDPRSFERLEASAVVLAVPGPVARRIAEGSRVLAPLAPYLEQVRYARAMSAVLRFPTANPGFYALAGEDGAALSWIGFEERKVGGRRMGDGSFVLVRPSAVLLEELAVCSEEEALGRLCEECRKAVPQLSGEPREATLVRWSHGLPTADGQVRIGRGGIPTDPLGLPIALAGDFTAGPRAELAARSGVAAAREILRRLERAHCVIS